MSTNWARQDAGTVIMVCADGIVLPPMSVPNVHERIRRPISKVWPRFAQRDVGLLDPQGLYTVRSFHPFVGMDSSQAASGPTVVHIEDDCADFAHIRFSRWMINLNERMAEVMEEIDGMLPRGGKRETAPVPSGSVIKHVRGIALRGLEA